MTDVAVILRVDWSTKEIGQNRRQGTPKHPNGMAQCRHGNCSPAIKESPKVLGNVVARIKLMCIASTWMMATEGFDIVEHTRISNLWKLQPPFVFEMPGWSWLAVSGGISSSPNPKMRITHSYSQSALNFDIEYLSGTASQVPPSYIVGRNLTAPWYLALCELWVLDHLFLGVIRTSHGVPRKKVGSRNFLRWAPIYVTQSHWHAAASRNRKENQRSSQQQRLLRMWWSRNPMRWGGWYTFCDFSDVHIGSEIGWKFTEHRSKEDRLRYSHRGRGSIPGSNNSFSDPSSVPERGHYRCTEDYSTMRGWLNSAFERSETIDRIF